ncbi:hypothetical protein IAQ61_006501 [Plenodomus lingam]|uniref:uncharacterized protein n=1 Tax=Leptosphaeria maculans TaxID=5022 RepID=UPI00332964F5|nr:hypothetical protein IAQ61_006501 [Plenodomus lingam]
MISQQADIYARRERGRPHKEGSGYRCVATVLPLLYRAPPAPATTSSTKPRANAAATTENARALTAPAPAALAPAAPANKFFNQRADRPTKTLSDGCRSWARNGYGIFLFGR